MLSRLRNPILKPVVNNCRLLSDTGISSYRARVIAQEEFEDGIKGRDFLLRYFVKDYLEKCTKLKINIFITRYYLNIPTSAWFQFMHDRKYMGSIIHIDNEEVYDKIRQYNLTQFMLDYVKIGCNSFLNVPNINVTFDKKYVTNDVLWDSNDSHQESYVKKQMIDDKNLFSIGFIKNT